MDRLEAMSIFIQVVDSGSFSGASRKLNIPLSTLTRKISELETYLKIQLIKRTTRHFELTEVGQSYIYACKHILEVVSEAESIATKEHTSLRGNLCITAPIVFGRLYVLPLVTEFLKIYPEIDIRMMLTDRNMNLIEEHIDMAIRIGELPDSSNIASKIGYVHKVVCASPSYLSGKPALTHPNELSKEDIITVESVTSPQVWTFIKGKTKLNVKIHSRLIVSTTESGIDAALDGLGITRVLSYQVAHHLKEKRLVAILEDFENTFLPINLVYPSKQFLPSKHRIFLDFIREGLLRHPFS